MRQIWITKAGPPEVLQVWEAPDPEPKAGEVRIRVEASGINFADILGRLGIYPDLPKLPCVPGYEVGGRVDALGPGVDVRWAGRDVFALTRFGGYADVVCVPLERVFERPAGMSAADGAALPVNYFTAWQLCVVMMLGMLNLLAGTPWLKFNPLTLMNANKGVFGVNLGHMWGEGERLRGWAAELPDLWRQGIIKPKIAQTFRFDEAPQAHHFIQDRKNVGKVLLTP
jgi:NADPH:quinone reductase-like Zn-dependent oxidoreductase